MKVSKDEQLAQRFFRLNTCVTILLLITIVVSVFQFGTVAWNRHQQVGLVLVGRKEDPGWNRTQYRGMKEACDALGFELLIQENVQEGEGNCRKAVQELVQRHAKLVFMTNTTSLRDMKDIVKAYPGLRFFGMELDPSVFEFNRYMVRYVEPFYLAGILAGLRTKTEKVGFVAPSPGPEFCQAINAFTLGVLRIRPQAHVFLAWTGGMENRAGEEQAVRDFKANSVDAMAYFQDGETIPAAADRAGIYFISMYEAYPAYHCRMAAIQVDWKKTYLNILRNNLRRFDRAIYWATILDRSVDIRPVTSALSARERAIFETEYWEVRQGKPVFSGEIYDRNGIRRCDVGETISNQSLPRMNWLVRGVRVIGN